ncbi:MAG: RagB/SusD family nutrient uptake outer membrane protein [Niabella sp.]|nr:RagB/SusD family nutrient uptake outer membrane protein [Niabella sp.]
MKFHINTYCLVLLLTVTLGSCKKYLDVTNPTTSAQDTVFSRLSYTNSAIIGVYAMLIGDNAYGNRISSLFPQTADDFKTSGSYSASDRRGISMYAAAATNTDLINPFIQLYKGIERANICIKYIPLSKLYSNGSDAEKATMRKYYGEALTLRAQFYYELVRNWGDLPFPTVPAADLADPYLPRTDQDSIYSKLIDDLKTAEDFVPWRTETTDQGARLTKGAVKGLRARIALARGGYAVRRASSKYGAQAMARNADYLTYYKIAKDECWDLMQHREQHTLNPVYENLFLTENTGKRYDDAHELMFEIGAFGGNANTDSKLGYYNGLRVNSGATVYGGGGGGILGIATYFYEFDSIGDCRRDVTLNAFEIDANGNKILNALNNMTDGKFRRPWTGINGTSQNLGVNWPVLRFADVLLMYAEADNEINGAPSADAIAALREVQNRAFVGHLDRLPVIPTDKAGFFNALVEERLLEFGGEGVRKYDLIRWNLINSKFIETRAKLTQLQAGTGRYANVPNVVYTIANAYSPFNPSVAETNNLNLYGGVPASVFYSPSVASTPSGYTSKAWRSSISAEYITGNSSGFATYFTPNHSEVFPTPSDVVNQNYRIQQDYGY